MYYAPAEMPGPGLSLINKVPRFIFATTLVSVSSVSTRGRPEESGLPRDPVPRGLLILEPRPRSLMVRAFATVSAAPFQAGKTVSETVGAMEGSRAGEGSQPLPALQARGIVSHGPPPGIELVSSQTSSVPAAPFPVGPDSTNLLL